MTESVYILTLEWIDTKDEEEYFTKEAAEIALKHHTDIKKIDPDYPLIKAFITKGAGANESYGI